MRTFRWKNGLRRGVCDRLLRFSVGVEEAEDLIADLKQVFATLKSEVPPTMSSREERLETTIIHASTRGDFEQKTGAVNVPIYLSSTFHQESFDKFGPYDYSRSGNPTRDALEKTIAALEGGARGLAFASGIAAISSAFMLLSSGDHIVVTEDVYGGTYRFVTKVLTKFGIDHTFVDLSELEAVSRAIKPNTKVIYIETPSNPRLGITDIEANR